MKSTLIYYLSPVGVAEAKRQGVDSGVVQEVVLTDLDVAVLKDAGVGADLVGNMHVAPALNPFRLAEDWPPANRPLPSSEAVDWYLQGWARYKARLAREDEETGQKRQQEALAVLAAGPQRLLTLVTQPYQWRVRYPKLSGHGVLDKQLTYLVRDAEAIADARNDGIRAVSVRACQVKESGE